ncbi:MAG: nitroreductase family protein [Candidatus Nanohaloarchaea archaeon]|nr:nitroreductase family protein [Candidatus Nanohaloarchaea archaeon]
MSPKELLDVMQNRVSVKKYKDQDIERDKIGKVLEAARWAPSAGNMQSWEFIIVEDYDLRQKLSQYSYNQEHIREAPVCLVILGDREKARTKFEERGENLYMIQETAAAMQNMLLMAESLGLGAAWVGAFNEENVADLLDVPNELRPMAMITLGYPRERSNPPNKYRVTDVTYMNRYGNRVHAIYDKIVWQGAREYARKAKNALKRKLGGS